jgi:hypothetical protein
MFKRVFVLLLVLGLAANASAALVASYDFEEGSGTNIYDGTSSYDGTLDPTDTPDWTTDAYGGNYAMDLSAGAAGDPMNGNVYLGTWDLGGTDSSWGVSMWIKWKGVERWWETPKWWSRGQALFTKMDSWNSADMVQQFMVRDWTETWDPCYADPCGDNAHWAQTRNGDRKFWEDSAAEYALLQDTLNRWAFLETAYDGTNNVMSIQLNGGGWYHKDWVAGSDTTAMTNIGMPDVANKYSWNGMVDDVKYYDNYIPEPATIALLGLGGLLLRRRRK